MNHENIQTIITHDGAFHADDVFAVAVLHNLYQSARIIRTRNKSITCGNSNGNFIAAVVVDVGGVFDPDKHLYDHHQIEGAPTPRANGIKRSSFGLIWEFFGEKYIERICNSSIRDKTPITKEQIRDIWVEIDSSLVSTIDAIDNGQAISNAVNYDNCRIIGLSTIISNFNLSYFEYSALNNSESDCESYAYSDYNAFLEAMQFASNILRRQTIKSFGKISINDYVKNGEKKFNSQLLILEYNGVPWIEYVVKNMPDVLYTIYQVSSGDWMLQAVPPALGSFEQRKPLPKEWGGLEDEKLQKLTDVKTAIFCHKNLFICSAKTKKDIIAMGKLAIDYNGE